MLSIEIEEYMKTLLEYSEKLKVKYGHNSSEYIKKLLFFISANHSRVQSVYEKQIAAAVKENDFVALKSVFYHVAKVKLLPCASGYDHCDRLWPLLDLLACAGIENIYRILPEGLPLSTNGYAMYVNGINVLLCLLYNREENVVYAQDKVAAKAEKFVTSKKTMWERAVVSCLLAILNHDVSRLSENLQGVCDSYRKINIAAYMKMQCQNVYGLIVLAKHVFSEEEFAAIRLPEHEDFSKGYIEWLLNQKELSDELCMTYEAPLEKINECLKKPVAVTRIHQPYINSDNTYLSSSEKKAWYIDIDTMMEEFIGK